MRGSRWWAAVWVAAVLFGAACSSDDPAPPDDSAAESSETPQPEPDPVCPITGEDPPRGVDLERPAIAVKVENSPQARPQSGLEHADLVFEERVEGGISRFMAIFHCGESNKVGPVRSGRFDDPKLAKPFTRLLAASGSNAIVERELANQKLVYLNELNTAALYRVPPGSTDIHSLFADTEKLRKVAVKRKLADPTSKTFTFGDVPGAAKRARRVTINFTDSNTIEYRFKGGAWKRFEAGAPFATANGGQITVPNLVVQQVTVNNSPNIVDSAGNASPDISIEQSSGRLWLFRDGRVIKGRWKMGKVGDPIRYLDKSGDPMVFAEGPVWIELVPSGKGEVKGKFAYK
jgi:hypothetical protein